MNDKRYHELAGTVGPFNVYKGKGWYANNCSMVKVQIPADDQALGRNILDKLIELQKEKFYPIESTTYFVVRSRPIRHVINKSKLVEYAIEIEIPTTQTLEWLTNNAAGISVTLDSVELGKDGWSVGPCVSRANKENTERYVKVRFNQMSIPFFLSKDRKAWVKGRTEEELGKSRDSQQTLAPILEFLTKNEQEILTRAQDRPYNKSGIAEYEPPFISFFVKDGLNYKLLFHQGSSNKIDQTKLADPKCNPIITLRYKKQYVHGLDYEDVIVALVDDQLKEVKRWTGGTTTYGYEQGWSGANTKFRTQDLSELNAEDEYVRERALRALKTRL